MEKWTLSPLSYGAGEYEPLAAEEVMRAHLAVAEACALLLRIATDGYPLCREMDTVALYRGAGRFPRTVSQDIRFGAGGLFCHEAYFRFLVPRRLAGRPSGLAEEWLRTSFGSADSFFYRFRMLAAETRLNGFLWVSVRRKNGDWRFELSVTEGYRLPDPRLGLPVFALDLWEHAYMTVWREERSLYAEAFLHQLDWAAVSGFLAEASAGQRRY